MTLPTPRIYVPVYSSNKNVAAHNITKQEFVRPRWPYDMRPSATAEKYMCVIVIR